MLKKMQNNTEYMLTPAHSSIYLNLLVTDIWSVKCSEIKRYCTYAYKWFSTPPDWGRVNINVILQKHKWIYSQWSCLSPNLKSFGLYTTNSAALFLLSLRPSSPFQFNDILYFVVHILKHTLLTTEFYEQDCSLPLHCSAYALCSFPPSTSLELTLELLVTPFVHVLFMVSDKSCSLE